MDTQKGKKKMDEIINILSIVDVILLTLLNFLLQSIRISIWHTTLPVPIVSQSFFNLLKQSAFLPKLLSESLMHLKVRFTYSWLLFSEHFIKICSCDWWWLDLLIHQFPETVTFKPLKKLMNESRKVQPQINFPLKNLPILVTENQPKQKKSINAIEWVYQVACSFFFLLQTYFLENDQLQKWKEQSTSSRILCTATLHEHDYSAQFLE